MHGGGTGQFASIPLNLTAPGEKANYVITGAWSEKAAKEAEKYITVNRVNSKPPKFVSIPDRSTWKVSYCDFSLPFLLYTLLDVVP